MAAYDQKTIAGLVPVNVNAKYQFKDAYYLFPIMQVELGKNPNLIQNPGY
jgi:hypothetical protein